MKLKEVMTREPQYLKPEASLQDAARTMKALDVGLLPVGDGKRLKGMITDRDITIRGTAEGCDPAHTAVADIMTPDVVFAFEDQDVAEAVEIMEERQIRRLVILDADKNMTGIVALADLATRTSDHGEKAHALEAVSA